MIQIIHNCSQATLARAQRALPPRKVFYWRGQFAKVRAIDYKTRTIWLYDVERPARRSIDDCSPAEWDEAARTARAFHRWHDWRGSRSGAPVAPNTRVEFVCRDNTRYTMEARFAIWAHGGGDKDIMRYRYA